MVTAKLQNSLRGMDLMVDIPNAEYLVPTNHLIDRHRRCAVGLPAPELDFLVHFPDRGKRPTPLRNPSRESGRTVPLRVVRMAGAPQSHSLSMRSIDHDR